MVSKHGQILALFIEHLLCTMQGSADTVVNKHHASGRYVAEAWEAWLGGTFSCVQGNRGGHGFFDIPEHWPLPLSNLLRGQSSSCPETRRGGTLSGLIDKGTTGHCSQHRRCLMIHTQQKVISCSDSVGQVLRVGGSPPHGDSRTSSFHLPSSSATTQDFVITCIQRARLHLRSLGPQAAHFTVTPQHLQLSYRAGGGLQKGLKPRGRERAETQPTFPLPDHVA